MSLFVASPEIEDRDAVEADNWATLNEYSVEITYGINSVISKLMTFVENAETRQFLFLIMLILSCFTCSSRNPFLSYDVITNFFK
jgi:hypothetical protein